MRRERFSVLRVVEKGGIDGCADKDAVFLRKRSQRFPKDLFFGLLAFGKVSKTQ